jgi:hypothetical protein
MAQYKLDASGNLVSEWAGIGVMSPDSGGPTRLLEGGVSPAWAPDGSRIIFSKDGDLYTVAPDGSDLKQLTQTPEREVYPTWSK